MTARIITVPRIDGHIWYDDIGYYLIPPYELLLEEQPISVRSRTSTEINVMNYIRPEIRVTVSTVPTR